jgi:cobalt-zinc-cadmium efflux system protein
MHSITDLFTSSVVIGSSFLKLYVSARTSIYLNVLGSIMISSVMATAASKLLRENGRILLQSAPSNFSTEALSADLSALKGLTAVKSARVWQLDVPDKLIGSLIISVEPKSDMPTMLETIRETCSRYNVTDVVIECR